MEYNFLPQVIRETLDCYGMVENEVLTILKSNGDLYNNPGEGYLVGFWNQVYLFSRSFTKSEYTTIQGVFAGDQVSMLELREEGYTSFLEVQIDDQYFTIKISSHESKDAEPIVAAWRGTKAMPSIAAGVADLVTINDDVRVRSSFTSGGEVAIGQKKAVRLLKKQAPQIAQIEECIDPLVIFLTAMLYVASSDGKEAAEELAYVRKICGEERRSFVKAESYHKDFSYDHFLTQLAHLDHTQSLCILANLLEVGMADGVLHRNEQQAIQEFANAVKITAEEFQAIRNVLLVKNQVSVFY